MPENCVHWMMLEENFKASWPVSQARNLQCEGDRVPSAFCEISCAGQRERHSSKPLQRFSVIWDLGKRWKQISKRHKDFKIFQRFVCRLFLTRLVSNAIARYQGGSTDFVSLLGRYAWDDHQCLGECNLLVERISRRNPLIICPIRNSQGFHSVMIFLHYPHDIQWCFCWLLFHASAGLQCSLQNMRCYSEPIQWLIQGNGVLKE